MPVFNGDNNDNLLTGGTAADTLNGFGGNDTLNGGGAADQLFGGEGNDLLQDFDGVRDSLFGGNGNDTFVSSATQIGGSDVVFLEAGDDTAFLGWITTGTNESVDGGTGNDTFNYSNFATAAVNVDIQDNGTLNFLGTISANNVYVNFENVIGNTVANTISGSSAANILDGGAGSDVLNGEGGDDTLIGGADGDTITGGSGNDSITGDGGADSITDSAGSDRIFGGDGADRITDTDGSNFVDGGLGDDTILVTGGDVSNSVQGGEGNDSITVFDSATSTNQIDGGSGNDTIETGDSLDTVLGGSGNDSISVGSNADSVNAGIGDDTVLAGNGDDSILGDAGNDSILGGLGSDNLQGDAGNDSIFGEGGNDLLFAGGGTDRLFGGADADSLFANAVDVIGGEVVDGGDTGTDNDTLTVNLDGFNTAFFTVVIDPTDAENGVITFFAANGTTVLGTLTFTDIEDLQIVCFTPGTRIATKTGEKLVEDLRPGDLVLTRDHGFQRLRWIGQRAVSYVQLLADPELQPVRIGRGAFGPDAPERSMMVSPQHRIFLSGAQVELHFGEDEVLVPAKHLVRMADVTRALPASGVTYIHLLFDRHEIVCSDGIWTESFHPSHQAVNAMEQAARAEILALFPELQTRPEAFPAARMSLKAHEARVLRDRPGCFR